MNKPTIKGILVDKIGWVLADSDPIEAFQVYSELEKNTWYRKGHRDFNGKYVIEVTHKRTTVLTNEGEFLKERDDPTLSKRELQAMSVIRSYNGTGTFPSIREIGRQLGYKSSRSPMSVTDSLVEKGLIEKTDGVITKLLF